jgi:hypothetical protein
MSACNGITQESEYTLRTGVDLIGSVSGEVSWQLTRTFTGPHTNKFISSYASGTYVYNSETGAKDACKARTDCNGVTRQLSGFKYTLRTGLDLNDSGSGEVSWQKTIAKSVLDLVGILGNIRKVRVQLEGRDFLHMREVQVFDKNGLNVALNKVATQSTTATGHPASNAVNGNLEDFSHTNGNEPSTAGK